MNSEDIAFERLTPLFRTPEYSEHTRNHQPFDDSPSGPSSYSTDDIDPSDGPEPLHLSPPSGTVSLRYKSTGMSTYVDDREDDGYPSSTAVGFGGVRTALINRALTDNNTEDDHLPSSGKMSLVGRGYIANYDDYEEPETAPVPKKPTKQARKYNDEEVETVLRGVSRFLDLHMLLTVRWVNKQWGSCWSHMTHDVAFWSGTTSADFAVFPRSVTLDSSNVFHLCELLQDAPVQSVRFLAVDKRGLSSVVTNFPSVARLDLAFCRELTDDALAEVGKLGASLTDLNIANCTQITDKGLRHLINCVRLTSLNLSGTKVTAAGVLLIARQCHKLQQLVLADLSIHENHRSVLAEIASDLPELREINLSRCDVTSADVADFLAANAPNTQQNRRSALASLTLMSCPRIDHNLFAPLARCASLRSVDLSFCGGVSSAMVKQFREVRHDVVCRAMVF